MKRCMIFNTKKFNSLLSLLLVASFSLRIGIKAEVLSVPNQTEQMQKGKNFIFTPQTIIKTNLPKQASCLFELQRILRERFGQSAIMGGFRAKGNSVIELWTDPEIKGQKHYILDISANKQIAPQHIEKCKKLNLLPTSHQTNRILYPGIIQLIPKSA